jgi:hypothetical protein
MLNILAFITTLIGSITFFILFYMGICYLISYIGGYVSLAWAYINGYRWGWSEDLRKAGLPDWRPPDGIHRYDGFPGTPEFWGLWLIQVGVQRHQLPLGAKNFTFVDLVNYSVRDINQTVEKCQFLPSGAN